MLQFSTPERIELKSHPEFSEKWVQDRIIDDPTILGLGELDLIKSEKTQHKAGRLDLLLHDDQLNRRYEVELMLGATDPSHIIRCIEYWDIEKRRYPSYDHVAVLVAEDVTSRFLNVMSLLAGSIPLIAIQLVALRVDDKIVLHCVQVLDQTSLRTDDEYESSGGTTGPALTERQYWDQRVTPQTMQWCDDFVGLVSQLAGTEYKLRYRKRIIDIVSSDDEDARLWLIPKKTVVRLGGFVSDPEAWVKRLDDMGYTTSLKRGNKAAMATFPNTELASAKDVVPEFVRDALDLEVKGTPTVA